MQELSLQTESYLRIHSTPMPPPIRTKTLTILEHLQGLYFSDVESVAHFNDTSYWEGLCDGVFHVRDDFGGSSSLSSFPKPTASSKEVLDTITKEGYKVIPAPNPSPQLYAKSHLVMTRLKSAGWPPSFIFLYDEIWTDLIMPLFDTYEYILGDGVWMEGDLNAWSLNLPPLKDEKSSIVDSYIGRSFTTPHRDMVYDSCHNEEDNPTSLNAWLPINPAGATSKNGAMRVLPIDDDDYFFNPSHPLYNDCARTLQFLRENNEFEDAIVSMECEAGEVCTWTPSLLHFGGVVEKGVGEPRMSVAATFRKFGADVSSYVTSSPPTSTEVDDDVMPVVGESESTGGPIPIQKNTIMETFKGNGKGITIERRLSYVAKAIIAFGHHYPGFAGLELERLVKGAR